MALRKTIVEVNTDELNVAEFCRLHGVSTWFFWTLRRRFQAEGEAALEPRSRAPHVVANRTPATIEDAIVAKRKELEDAGLDFGAETIAFHLRDVPGMPSPSTIWRILRDRGCITPQPSKAPKRTWSSFTAERANDCWQLDDTFWELADGTEVKILNVIDDHSRLLVASVAMRTCTGAGTLVALAKAAVVLGWPARFLSDNAKAFRHTLADALGAMGVGHGHSRPYHPQTNGKVERFHETLKKWLRARPRAQSLGELQVQLDCFRHLYNHERPHRSLGRRFPAAVWAAAPKSGPSSRPLGISTVVHHKRVRTNGVIDIGRRYQIGLGVAFAGEEVVTVITGTACHVFIEGRLVRSLTLDPSRRSQPQGPPRLP